MEAKVETDKRIAKSQLTTLITTPMMPVTNPAFPIPCAELFMPTFPEVIPTIPRISPANGMNKPMGILRIPVTSATVDFPVGLCTSTGTTTG